MDSATTTAMFDGLGRMWNAAGPLIGGVIGAALTAMFDARRGGRERAAANANWLRDERAKVCLRLLTDLSALAAASARHSALWVQGTAHDSGDWGAAVDDYTAAFKSIHSNQMLARALGMREVSDGAMPVLAIVNEEFSSPTGIAVSVRAPMDALYSSIQTALAIPHPAAISSALVA
ncbi:MAG: hypothetical protein HHJ10_01170 [Cellulomonas sp.]|uniref:hypothetical protein n=1 Tax=Cellulomonas sp. TaxID=40001 RepID=UPI0017C13EF8|nr:hypothetical protein [Cellulomonas sp.]NMM29680.1 hypothetical protein [Cellulomonas sp.]